MAREEEAKSPHLESGIRKAGEATNMVKVIPVNKSSARRKVIVVYKSHRIFDYKILREMPLCYLDEEEFKFVKKTLLEARPEEGCSICQ